MPRPISARRPRNESAAGRIALRPASPARRRDGRAPRAGSTTAIAPFSAIPRATATMPSASMRTRMKASPATLPSTNPSSGRDVVVQRRQRARRQARVELQDRGEHHPGEDARGSVDRRLGAAAGQEPGDIDGPRESRGGAAARRTRRASRRTRRPRHPSRLSSRARASGGSTITRIPLAASSTTTKTA